MVSSYLSYSASSLKGGVPHPKYYNKSSVTGIEIFKTAAYYNILEIGFNCVSKCVAFCVGSNFVILQK